MRLRTRNLAVVVATLLFPVFAATPTLAQAPVPIEGTVVKADTKEPVEGADVDIYRTDIKGKYQTKTDKRGKFTYPVPAQGTYVIIVSAPNLAPQYQAGVRVLAGYPPSTFTMPAGGGQRPTLEDVQKAMTGGGGPAGGGKEDPKAAEERAKAEAEYEKARAEAEGFNARKARFDAGIAAMQAKDYPTSITELGAAIEGLDANTDPKFYGELLSVGGTNLAEVHYRVAVDLYNSKQRDEAKKHLEAGAKAIALALKFGTPNQSTYAIQGKVVNLLVDKFGVADDAEAGANAYLKAAELETADPKKKVAYLVSAGDTYRAALMTDKAIEIYKQVLAADQANPSAYYGIGLAAMAVSTDDAAKQKQYYQTAADYLDAFVDKAPSTDQRTGEVKGLLDILAKDFKIKPRPLGK